MKKKRFLSILWWLISVHIKIRWNLGWSLLASWIGNWCHIKHYINIISTLSNLIWQAICKGKPKKWWGAQDAEHSQKRAAVLQEEDREGGTRLVTNGYQWLPFQTHIKCMYQRFTLGGSDAGWAKHDLTYRVKGYPSDPNIQRQTVRKFCGLKKNYSSI